MHEHGLARELWPQLKALADEKQLTKVTRVEMIVGMLHGVSADFLAHSFEHAFEGTSFEGAVTEITVVDPGDSIPAEGGTSATATGWELMITRMEGDS